MNEQQMIVDVAKELGVTIPADDSSEIRQLIVNFLNKLLLTDFEKLISILYRADVNENKLKQVLKENPNTDAGVIIADLIFERQAQKIKSRQEFRRDSTISDEESW